MANLDVPSHPDPQTLEYSSLTPMHPPPIEQNIPIDPALLALNTVAHIPLDAPPAISTPPRNVMPAPRPRAALTTRLGNRQWIHLHGPGVPRRTTVPDTNTTAPAPTHLEQPISSPPVPQAPTQTSLATSASQCSNTISTTPSTPSTPPTPIVQNHPRSLLQNSDLLAIYPPTRASRLLLGARWFPNLPMPCQGTHLFLQPKGLALPITSNVKAISDYANITKPQFSHVDHMVRRKLERLGYTKAELQRLSPPAWKEALAAFRYEQGEPEVLTATVDTPGKIWVHGETDRNWVIYLIAAKSKQTLIRESFRSILFVVGCGLETTGETGETSPVVKRKRILAASSAVAAAGSANTVLAEMQSRPATPVAPAQLQPVPQRQLSTPSNPNSLRNKVGNNRKRVRRSDSDLPGRYRASSTPAKTGIDGKVPVPTLSRRLPRQDAELNVPVLHHKTNDHTESEGVCITPTVAPLSNPDQVVPAGGDFAAARKTETDLSSLLLAGWPDYDIEGDLSALATPSFLLTPAELSNEYHQWEIAARLRAETYQQRAVQILADLDAEYLA